MPLRRRVLLGSVTTALVFAGCQSDGGDGTGGDTDTESDGGAGESPTPSPTTTPSPTATEGPATVQVRSHDEYGDMLVGPEELTLYMFEKDTQDEHVSACADGCAETWPPLTVEDDPTKSDNVITDLQTFQ